MTKATADWKAARVAPATSLAEAVGVLDKGRLGIVLVIEDDDRLVGTVTDGDVRRALLRGVRDEVPASDVMCRDFVSLGVGASLEEAGALMREKSIRHVPVLDGAGRVQQLVCVQDFLGNKPLPNTLFIAAGGEGRRLLPLTARTPKPMLAVGGRPILQGIIERAVRQGFRDVFISVNYLADHIIDHFGDGTRFGCRITYVREGRPLGTGGALGLLPQPPDQPMVVVNGDLVTDVDLAALVSFHEEEGAAATVCVRDHADEIPYGVVTVGSEGVTSIREKPIRKVLINAGIYVLEPRVLELVPPNEKRDLPELLAAVLAAGERVAAFHLREPWIDVGRPVEYERAQHAGEESE